MAAKAAIHDKLQWSRIGSYTARHRSASVHNAMPEFSTKDPCVYIMASKPNGILYVGVTSALHERVSIHKQDLHRGFTKRYAVHRLVYYEMHDTMDAAIKRETQLKKWKRAWKVRLIHGMNPEWRDLFDDNLGDLADGQADVQRRKV